MSNQTIRPLYDSPDLTYIDKKALLQRNIPSHISEIHNHVSAIANTPSHSYLDELLGTTVYCGDIIFEPPPGHAANGCFRAGVLPNIDPEQLSQSIQLVKASSQSTDSDLPLFEKLEEEITVLETLFSQIKVFMLRFCKG